MMKDQTRVFMFVGLIAALAFANEIRPVTTPDTFWHLTAASQILEQGSTHIVDEATYTKPGDIFISQPWLGQLILYFAYQALGVAGLSILCGFTVAVSILLVAALAWSMSKSDPLITITVTALIAPILSWRFAPRPYIFAHLLLIIALLVMGGLQRKLRWRLGCVLLYLLQTLWCSIHGSYVVLPIVVSIYLVVSLSACVKEYAAFLSLVLVGQLVIVIALGGVEHLDIVVQHSLDDATELIAEMHSLKLENLWPIGFNTIFYLEAVLFLGVLRELYRERASITEILLVLLGCCLTLNSHRFRALLAILAVPFVARPVQRLPRPNAWSAIVSMVALLSLPLNFVNELRRTPEIHFGFGLGQNLPIQEALFIERQALQGNLFNIYEDGAYLIFKLNKRGVRMAIDGRLISFFSSRLFYEIRSSRRHPEAFYRFAQSNSVEMALIAPKDPVCASLFNNSSWRAVFATSRRVLFVKDGLIERFGIPTELSVLNPCRPRRAIASVCGKGRDVSQAKIASLGAELRSLAEASTMTSFSDNLIALYLESCASQLEGAAFYLERSVSSNPNNADAWRDYSRVLSRLSRFNESLKAAKVFQYLAPSYASNTILARAHIAAGNYHEARRILRELLIKTPEKGHLLQDLIEVSYKVGDNKAAASYRSRLDLINPPAK